MANLVLPNTPQTAAAVSPTTPLKKIIITIVVILVLAGLVLVGVYFYKLQGAKKRDSQRKADLDAIKQALELYKADTQDNQYYPGSIGSGGATGPLVSPVQYIKSVPVDPKTATVYAYAAAPSGCLLLGTCTEFTLTACLENKNDKGENTTEPIPPCETRSYQVTHP